jgi:hypothetical protein
MASPDKYSCSIHCERNLRKLCQSKEGTPYAFFAVHKTTG